jgi:hypothetical protein
MAMPSARSIRRQKKTRPGTGRFAALRKKLRATGGFENTKVVTTQPGELKMSDALDKLVEPYARIAPQTLAARKKLLTLGMAAWNMALLPHEKQVEFLDDAMTAIPATDQQARDDMRLLLKELAARKRKLFPDVWRYLVSFTLEDDGDQWHLSVASMPFDSADSPSEQIG